MLFGLFHRTHVGLRVVRKSPSGLLAPFLFLALLMLNEGSTLVPHLALIASTSEASLTPWEWLTGLMVLQPCVRGSALDVRGSASHLS